MAVRPVFVPFSKAPYFVKIDTSFVWNAGQSVSQKKKNVVALHEAFVRRYPEKSVLEISTKSLQEEGVSLSAFNLMKFVPSLGKQISVECAYQGSKAFERGGPYTDIYDKTSRQAKLDERLTDSGRLVCFSFEGESFPPTPHSTFYDWLYINALSENPELARKVLGYDGFTDIEFNPEKGISCQAQSAAVYKSLHSLGLLDECRDFNRFRALLTR